jgi:hypothetical protein
MPDAALAAIYEQLAAESAGGIDAAAQAREAACLRAAPGGAVAVPFPEPFGSIRLFAAPLRLEEEVLQALSAVVEVITAPGRWHEDAVFLTPLQQHHITLFHTGRPGDARPGMDDAARAAELEAGRAVAAATPPFTLVVERVLLSHTGVLLLLFQTRRDDRTPFALRDALRAAFPDAPAKQSVLLHASLARVLTQPASPEALAAVHAACERATQQLRGQEVRVWRVWHIVERALPIDGDITALDLLA